MNSGAKPSEAPSVTKIANTSSPPDSGPDDGSRQAMMKVKHS